MVNQMENEKTNKQIQVSEETHILLSHLKADLKLRDFNAVIYELIRNFNEDKC